MKLRVKRYLYLVHRWFGVGMCVLFAMWFATGIIMMYVEYPELTEEERLATLAPLDFAGVYDERSDRVHTVPELIDRGYEDAYRLFIEPVVAASGEGFELRTAE